MIKKGYLIKQIKKIKTTTVNKKGAEEKSER